MSLSGFGVLAVGRKVTNPFIYLPIAFSQKYENRLCLAADDLAKKIETPNDRLHSGFKKTNGLYFGFEVGLGCKKYQVLLCASTGKA